MYTNLKNLFIDEKIQYIINKCEPTQYPGIYKKIEITNNKAKKLITIIGPSKSGKTTIINYLSKYYPKVKTLTTRPKRPDELEDEYIWAPEKQLENEEIDDYIHRIKHIYNLIETNYFAGFVYGTPQESINKAFEQSNIAIIGSENNGAKAFKSKLSDKFDVITLFVLPDSIETIKKRINYRNNIEERLKIAEKEIEESLEITNFYIHNTEIPLYIDDINNVLEKTLKNVLNLIRSIELNNN